MFDWTREMLYVNADFDKIERAISCYETWELESEGKGMLNLYQYEWKPVRHKSVQWSWFMRQFLIRFEWPWWRESLQTSMLVTKIKHVPRSSFVYLKVMQWLSLTRNKGAHRVALIAVLRIISTLIIVFWDLWDWFEGLHFSGNSIFFCSSSRFNSSMFSIYVA